jgi:phospholipid/cholesterol/gamma-HCH transport system ATP-binding protein
MEQETDTTGSLTSDERSSSPAVVFDKVSFAFDDHVILHEVSFSVPRGSMSILLGASGAGKSILLRLIMGLLRPDDGCILVEGERIDRMSEHDLLRVRGDIGMLFQENALFDSLTVAENVGYQLYEETDLPSDEVRSRVAGVLGFVGLGEYGERMPSALSGGQRRRVAIARAMAARPIDDEIVKLRDLEQVTSVLATHQIRDAFYVARHEAVNLDGRAQILPASDVRADVTRFMVLHEGQILFEGSGRDLLASQDTYLKEFLFMTLPPW